MQMHQTESYKWYISVYWMFFLIKIIFLSQIAQSEEPVDQAETSDRLKQKGQTQLRPSLCASGLWGERAFHISHCMDCNVCKGALRTDRTDMKKERPLRLWMFVKTIWALRSRSVLKQERKMTIHSTFPVTVFHSKWSILYLFFYTCLKFLLPHTQIKVIYFWDISECWMDLESAHFEFCKYLATSSIKKKKKNQSIIPTSQLSGYSL